MDFNPGCLFSWGVTSLRNTTHDDFVWCSNIKSASHYGLFYVVPTIKHNNGVAGCCHQVSKKWAPSYISLWNLTIQPSNLDYLDINSGSGILNRLAQYTGRLSNFSSKSSFSIGRTIGFCCVLGPMNLNYATVNSKTM